MLPFDVLPGQRETVALTVAVPSRTGTYAVKPDLIREGKTWLSATGAKVDPISLRVTAQLDAGYGGTTAPASIVPGGEVNIEVPLKNTGLGTWAAGGAHPVNLGYHQPTNGREIHTCNPSKTNGPCCLNALINE